MKSVIRSQSVKIIEGIYRDPKAYELGYGASLAEIERVIGLVREAYMRVKKDQLPLDKVLVMTHNFESAMMESRVFEVLSTSTKEARELLDSIYQETNSICRKSCRHIRQHSLFEEKLKKVPGEAARTFFVKGKLFLGVFLWGDTNFVSGLLHRFACLVLHFAGFLFCFLRLFGSFFFYF